MYRDSVDELVQQWAEARPALETAALGVVVRIERLGTLLRRRANRALKRHGLKHWEYDVLSVLRRQRPPFELPATDIARAAHLTSGATTTRVDGLQARGLVLRRQHARDGRSVLVRLTPAGRELIDEAIVTRVRDADSFMAAVAAGERRELAACLRRLLVTLEP
ncbi:MAG TPA: MarR family transcriptional regulator [Woeseiaceae bacterium]|nr:MarR family transcriptional regulator [Woeseiaceae bacterium]